MSQVQWISSSTRVVQVYQQQLFSILCPRLFFNRAVMSQLFFERASVKQLDSIPLRIFGMFLTSEQIDNDEHQRSKIFVKKRQSLKDRVLAHQSTRAPKSVERARLRLRVS